MPFCEDLTQSRNLCAPACPRAAQSGAVSTAKLLASANNAAFTDPVITGSAGASGVPSSTKLLSLVVPSGQAFAVTSAGTVTASKGLTADVGITISGTANFEDATVRSARLTAANHSGHSPTLFTDQQRLTALFSTQMTDVFPHTCRC